MQHLVYELRRIPIPRTWVNKGMKEGRDLKDSILSLLSPASAGLISTLRRLMRNCGRRGRSRNLMLAPNLLPKAVPHNGSRLLLGFIVRPDRRLVESQPPLGHTPPWPSHPPERPGGPDAG